jgi:hypothetical protein
MGQDEWLCAATPLSFKNFLKSVRAANYREYVKTTPDLTKKNFAEMKAYILDYYDGVKVVRSVAADGGVVFDCVVTGTQPAARHQLNGAANPPPSLPPPPPPQQRAPHPTMTPKTAEPSFASSCREGTIPLRRLTLQQMVSFKSLRGLFQKSEGESVPR